MCNTINEQIIKLASNQEALIKKMKENQKTFTKIDPIFLNILTKTNQDLNFNFQLLN
jgi:uncharacterized protein YigA (DUF484 family)